MSQRLLRAPALPPWLYVTIQSPVSRPSTGKWAVAHSSSYNLFFFTHFFFICSTHCKTTKKNVHFPVEPKKIIYNLLLLFFIPLVASLLLLKCSSLDNCNSYNSKISRLEQFKLQLILTRFLVQKLEQFSRISQNTSIHAQKLEQLSINFFFFIYSWTTLPKILKLLRFYFLNPSVRHFPICYSPSIQTHNSIAHHN